MILINLTTLLYSVAFLLQWQFLVKKTKFYKYGGFVTTLLGLILHAYLLYSWIDIAGGQNLTFFTLLSLLVWLVCVIIECLSIRQPMAYLLLFGIPLAMFSIWLVWAFPVEHIVYTAAHWADLIHIVLAILVFAIFCVTALQAISLAWMHHRLRSKPASGLMQIESFPSLEAIEKSMFIMMALGFVLLTVLIGMSVYFFYDIFFSQLIKKSLLTLVAWFIFAFILVGRFVFGWRGRKAVYGTLSGVAILMIVYFFSQLFMGLLP